MISDNSDEVNNDELSVKQNTPSRRQDSSLIKLAWIIMSAVSDEADRVVATVDLLTNKKL